MLRKVLFWKASLAACALALAAFLSASPAAAQDKCTLKDGKGIYIGTFTGFITASPNPAFVGPYAAVARVSCDGKGKCAGKGTQSFNGIVVPLVDTGEDVAVVNEDCTGSITVNLPVPPFALHFDVVQTKDGKELFSVQTDAGAVVTGHLILISRNPD